jgi:hypothetical protein
MWRFRGTPHYLDAQGTRLGLSKVLTDRARHNPEIHRISVLLGQLAERYHKAPKGPDGQPSVYPMELAQVKGTLGQAEQELCKLYALAAAAQQMIDEAWRAFGEAAPHRQFRIRCDFDDLLSEADLVPIKLTPERALARRAKVPAD